MNTQRLIDVILTVLLVVVALAALGLVAASSSQFNDTKAVYQGF